MNMPYCLLPTAYCLLPTAYCLLPTAYCLLPTAHCPLPTAHCPLPTAHCPLPTAHYLATMCWAGSPRSTRSTLNQTACESQTQVAGACEAECGVSVTL